jgi:hypothetical protein
MQQLCSHARCMRAEDARVEYEGRSGATGVDWTVPQTAPLGIHLRPSSYARMRTGYWLRKLNNMQLRMRNTSPSNYVVLTESLVCSATAVYAYCIREISPIAAMHRPACLCLCAWHRNTVGRCLRVFHPFCLACLMRMCRDY